MISFEVIFYCFFQIERETENGRMITENHMGNTTPLASLSGTSSTTFYILSIYYVCVLWHPWTEHIWIVDNYPKRRV